MARRIIISLAALAAVVALTIVTTIALHGVRGTVIPDVKYIDLIAVVLSALSVMITVLGIFLAALAIIGWATFETKLRDSSLNYFTSQLGEGGALRKELEALLVDISLKGVQGQSGNADPETGPEKPYND